jgi:NAD(P)-dependent dehydrogenase (short-subunit alcohol dehydrogenase family)
VTGSPSPVQDLAGKVTVVTGASAGAGRATALRFARCGAHVALIARDGAALDEVRQEIEGGGARAIAVACDVADAERLAEAGRRIERELGPIAIWVNCAMVTVFSPLWRMTADEFRRVTEVTYLGYVYGTMTALACMRPRNAGLIIQAGSSLAYRGIPLQSAYCGAKHAIRGFTDSLRCELIHEGSAIGLVMVQLPAMNTPQFDWARTHMARQPRPVGPVVQPEVAAQAIVRAALAPRRELWLGLSTVKVILGSMLAPAFLDRYLARHAFEGQERPAAVSPQRRDNLTDPVHTLHSTRGSFGAEAGGSAPLLSGEAARLWAGLLGVAGVLLAAGLASRLAGAARTTGALRRGT